MCGIAGLTLMPPGPIKSEWLEAFLQVWHIAAPMIPVGCR